MILLHYIIQYCIFVSSSFYNTCTWGIKCPITEQFTETSYFELSNHVCGLSQRKLQSFPYRVGPGGLFCDVCHQEVRQTGCFRYEVVQFCFWWDEVTDGEEKKFLESLPVAKMLVLVGSECGRLSRAVLLLITAVALVSVGVSAAVQEEHKSVQEQPPQEVKLYLITPT